LFTTVIIEHLAVEPLARYATPGSPPDPCRGQRLAQQGQQTKMEQVYQYLTGIKFRQSVEAVVEKFNDMREDLDKERKFMGRQWAKRETQILSVIESTVGMVGDLQAIAGKAMPEIPSLDMPLLESSAETERKAG
jgi:hypothetical protein